MDPTSQLFPSSSGRALCINRKHLSVLVLGSDPWWLFMITRPSGKSKPKQYFRQMVFPCKRVATYKVLATSIIWNLEMIHDNFPAKQDLWILSEPRGNQWRYMNVHACGDNWDQIALHVRTLLSLREDFWSSCNYVRNKLGIWTLFKRRQFDQSG